MSAKTRIAGLMMVLMAFSVPMVYAHEMGDEQSRHHGGDWHHDQQDHMMSKVLNLTADQDKQIKDLQQKQKEAMKSTFEAVKSNREAFDSEIAKATPDMSKINDLQTQLKTIQSQMLDEHLQSLLEIKKIMTPEQYAGFMALKKERKLMGHDKFKHKGGFHKDEDRHGHGNDKKDEAHPEGQE